MGHWVTFLSQFKGSTTIFIQFECSKQFTGQAKHQTESSNCLKSGKTTEMTESSRQKRAARRLRLTLMCLWSTVSERTRRTLLKQTDVWVIYKQCGSKGVCETVIVCVTAKLPAVGGFTEATQEETGTLPDLCVCVCVCVCVEWGKEVINHLVSY